MLFFAIVWSLWLIRNDLIFKQREPDYDTLFLFILTRLCVWFRALCLDFPYNALDMLISADGLILRMLGLLLRGLLLLLMS
jgi:hypothetical protein